jgi:hypothetical protein
LSRTAWAREFRLPGLKSSSLIRRILTVLAAASLLAAPKSAFSQSTGARNEVFAGSVFESYLRYLQTLGKSKPTQWSIRALGPEEIDALAPRDSAHPWAARYDFSKRPADGRMHSSIVLPSIGLIVNTGFPWGSNDGPIWAGKGLSSWAQVGASVRYRGLSLRLVPIAFRSENTAFPLWENGQIGTLQFANGQFPLEIDLPQRFGDAAYSRFDLGESTLRLDGKGLTVGLSTASQWWGPTVQFPYVLGNNAGGFPHLFLGTSKPANIGIGQIHGHLVYGTLSQSPFSPVRGKSYFQTYTAPGRDRFMAGVVGLIRINGIPGFELGGTRFFHSAMDSSGIAFEDFKLPFQNLLKNRLKNEGDTVFGDDRSLLQNQLASIFMRWAPPNTGIEIYGEFGREDFSADLRDFYLESDHSSTQSFGFRKAWMNGSKMTAMRGEWFNYEAPAGTRTRGEGLIYRHQPLLQGHTFRGQLLGSNVGPGAGSAQILGFDRFSPGGRWSGYVSRVEMGEISSQTPDYVTGPPKKSAIDVQYTLGVETTRFVGPFDITGRVALTRELNRYLANDASNANFALTIRQAF